MFQKFYTDTLGSRYIKSLLAQTPIPVFESVVDGDQIIAGCYYVYRTFIIRCNTSGIIAVGEQEDLYPSDTLYPSVFLFPGTGIRCATFYVKSIVDEYNVKTHATYHSSTNYYDSETHYELGRYLRYTLTTTGLNLFPFYNCYNGTYFADVELYKSSFRVEAKRVSKQSYKVVAIPILFGHTYTISIDCPTNVLIRPIIYDDSGYIEEDKLPKELSETLRNAGKQYSRLQFKEPVKFRVETDFVESYMLQRNLYLIIQLPVSNDSSIVVLENFIKSTGISCVDENSSVRKFSISNPSLLSMNTRTSYAFSDRLIEYLVGNVIYKDDPIVQNIEHGQTSVSECFYDYKRTFISKKNKKGIWDNELSNYIYSLVEDNIANQNMLDQDGSLNKDILSVIYRKGVKTIL